MKIKNILKIFLLAPLFVIASTDEQLLHRVFNEELKREVIKIEPIKNGLTNHSFKVQTKDYSYFARVGSQSSDILSIDRQKELIFLRETCELGLSPTIEYVDPVLGILVLPFLDNVNFWGKVLGKWSDDKRKVIEDIIKSIKSYHSIVGPETLEKNYCFDIIEKYMSECKKKHIIVPLDLEACKIIILRAKDLLGKQEKVKNVLCHNDLFWGNLLFDGKRLWIVDWEYADWGDPFYDLASLCIGHALDEEERLLVLKTYYPSFGEQDVQRLEIMCMLFSLKTFFWSYLQNELSESSQIDMQAVAKIHLTNYREFIKRLKIDWQ